MKDSMTTVKYHLVPSGPIVLTADRIFSSRVTDRNVREAVLNAVEAFVDAHSAELQRTPATARIA